MVVSNINDINTDTIDEAVANEDLHDLLLNATKSIRNFKKRPDCSVIYDYLSKLIPNSEISEKSILNRLEYLTNNNTLENKPNNGKDPYFIVNKTDQNMPDVSLKQIPCSVNIKTPSVIKKHHQKIDLIEVCLTTKIKNIKKK